MPWSEILGRAWKNGFRTCRDAQCCGHARLTSPREIAVGPDRLSADKIFINAGARPLVPGIPGLDQIDYLTNETIMDLDIVATHLLVLGGSYVGLEFAQIYHRFGSEVTVIEAAPKLVPREDDDISAAIKEILESEGIRIRLATRCSGFAKRDGQGVARLETSGGQQEVTASHVLIAIGRKPNTDDLGLEAAGVKVDARGYIVTDESLRTNAPSIWALGECNGRGAFTHTSYNDYEIVAANLLDHAHRRVTDRILTYALFTDPPLGRVGMTEHEARQTGRRILIGKRAMSRVARAVEKGETQGFMKVLVDDETRKILGAAILGTSGDEAIHCITHTMYADVPYDLAAGGAHSSDGVGAHPDRAVRDDAALKALTRRSPRSHRRDWDRTRHSP
jgi:pyruvate/2-oxoglutarate dehydrogenase complex dihydrolipoamide dehydrogenase (E3) component